MRNFIKNFIFTLVFISLVFGSIELVSRLFFVRGSYDYIERRIIEDKYSPKKKKGEFRIQFYGESTMHGHHLFPKSTIDKWVKMYAKSILGEEFGNKIVTMNFGRLGEPSKFHAETLEDTVGYKPDLIVIYSAHNDFCILENRNELFKKKSLSQKLSRFFSSIAIRSYFISALRRVTLEAKLKRHQKRDEAERAKQVWYDEVKRKNFDPTVDFLEPGGEHFLKIKENWEHNIKRIIATAQKNKIPVIFYSGIARYKGYEPFYSVHKKILSPEGLLKFNNLFWKGEELLEKKDFAAALKVFQEAMALDDNYALGFYRAATCLEELGQYAEAYRLYKKANDKDYCPIRGPSMVNDFYKSLAKDNLSGVYVINTQEAFDSVAPHGIVDETMILDQLHPSIEGQALMAQLLLKTMEEKKIFAADKQWQWENLKPAEEYVSQLGFDQEFLFKRYIAEADYVGSYYDKAIVLVNKSLEIKPDSVQALSMLAWLKHKKGDKEEALAIYRDLVLRYPELARPFLERHPAIDQAIH